MLNMILLFIGTTELIVIGGIALLIFGGKKLPELMRGLGKGVKEFKEGMHDVQQEMGVDAQSGTAGEEPSEKPSGEQQQEEKPLAQ